MKKISAIISVLLLVTAFPTALPGYREDGIITVSWHLVNPVSSQWPGIKEPNGDSYVDMLSLDWYGQGEEFNRNVKAALDFTTSLAARKGKLHALSECGPLSDDLQKILADYESAYVLTWRNAPPRGKPIVVPAKPDKNRNAFLHSLKKNHYFFLQDIKSIH